MKTYLLMLWLGGTLLIYFIGECIWNPSPLKVFALVFVAGSLGFNLSSFLWHRAMGRHCAELSKLIHGRDESQ